MNPKIDQGEYACQYPTKTQRCAFPAFDWIELNALSPPLRVRVCARHWMEYTCPDQEYYELPPESSNASNSVYSEMIVPSENNASPERASILRDLDALLAVKDARERMKCRRGE